MITAFLLTFFGSLIAIVLPLKSFFRAYLFLLTEPIGLPSLISTFIAFTRTPALQLLDKRLLGSSQPRRPTWLPKHDDRDDDFSNSIEKYD